MKYLHHTIMFFFLFLTSSVSAHAATLSLDPASTSVPLNQTFTVKLMIDTEGETTTSTDAILLYDSAILSVISVEDGDNGANPFFPDVYPNMAPGELYIGASVQDPIDTRSGIGTVATITFQGITTGTSNVVFDCTAGRTSDTNISKSDKNQTDIVNCDGLINGRYSIGTGLATPVPTSPVTAQQPAFTPTPTLIRAGTADTTVGIAGLGMLLLAGGFVAIKLR